MAKKTYKNFSMKLVQKATTQLDRAFISAQWNVQNLKRLKDWCASLDKRIDAMTELAKKVENVQNANVDAEGNIHHENGMTRVGEDNAQA